MVLYLLNLLAFLAHKGLELGDRLYQQGWAGESRRGLWILLRRAFYLVAVESWEALLLHHLREAAHSPSDRPAQAEARAPRLGKE